MATRGLSKLKGEMAFNLDLARLVDVMKGIAASQYTVMERKRSNLERFGKATAELFETYDFRMSHHPFIRPKNPKKLICVITTDGGFLGGLNMKVTQAGTSYEEKGTHYLVVGERGVNFMREFGKSYTAFPGINADESRFPLMEKILDEILRLVLQGEYGRVLLVYPFSISFTAQRVEVLNLIPCPLFFSNKPDLVPTEEEQVKDVILESPEKDVIEYLTALWLRKRLIEVFENAKLSEFGARTMHLEDSFQTLTKLNKHLRLEYFKARREKIDQSLRETFTSQLFCDKEAA